MRLGFEVMFRGAALRALIAPLALCGSAALGTGCEADEAPAAADGGSPLDGEVDGLMADAALDPDAAVEADMTPEADAGPDPCRIDDPPAVEPALATALDEALAGALEGTAAAGIAARVVLPDGRGWAGAVGVDDIRGDAPLRRWARFRIASVTKTFIAAAIMQRVERGDWGLDDPITDWVDGFDLDPGVTFARLLNHTSGVFNYTDDVSFLLRRMERLTPAEVVAFALHNDSGLAPGDAFLYSNTGYFLLGMALEALEQRPLADILRDELITPLGLPHIWLEQFEEAPEGCDIGQGHVTFDPGITEGFDAGWVWAAGGLASPTADLCMWMRALIGGEVLPAEVIAEMSVPTPQSLEGDEFIGLGIMQVERAGRTLHGHTGSTMGFRGEVFVADDGTCVAVETNDFTSHQDVAAQALWSVLAR